MSTGVLNTNAGGYGGWCRFRRVQVYLVLMLFAMENGAWEKMSIQVYLVSMLVAIEDGAGEKCVQVYLVSMLVAIQDGVGRNDHRYTKCHCWRL